MGKPVLKVMFDTNVFDQLFDDLLRRNKVEALIEMGSLEIWANEIIRNEIDDINLNKKPQAAEMKRWSLSLLGNARISSPMFSYDVRGAGYDQGQWGSNDEMRQYSQIKPNSRPGHHINDRLISIAANSGNSDYFVTNDAIRIAQKEVLRKIKILSYDEFAIMIDGY